MKQEQNMSTASHSVMQPSPYPETVSINTALYRGDGRTARKPERVGSSFLGEPCVPTSLGGAATDHGSHPRGTTAMNSRLFRYSVGLVAAVLLLQSYFVRQIVVLELLFALLLIVASLIGGTACLIGYAVLLWLKQPRRSHAKPQVIWKERTFEQ